MAANTSERIGWAMYDFANSSYTTVIVTVYYAVVFPKVIVGDAPEYRLGNALWSVTLSLSYALVVLTLPVLGAAMDQLGGKRKWFLLASTVLTVAATAGLGFVGPGQVGLAMVLVVLGNYGFSLGESFVASFLPGLGPPELLGKISGFAWGLGYVGGLGSAAVVLFGLGPPALDNPAARWAGPVTALWFAVASIPTFALLVDRSQPAPVARNPVVSGFSQLVDTLRHAGKFRDLMVFLVGHTFSMAGLSIVISFAFIYGDQVIRWTPATQSAMFVTTQLTATVGALGFGWLQGRFGDKPTYLSTLVLWCLAVVLIRFTPELGAAARAAGSSWTDSQWFLGVGALAGLCIGSTQSAARTLVALLSPADRVGEFFGLWGMFGKAAAILGLMALAGLQALVGLQSAILLTGGFFFLGLVVTGFVDVARGQRAAAG
ncbi:MAG: MFS transporter [Myxococcota bacterium]